MLLLLQVFIQGCSAVRDFEAVGLEAFSFGGTCFGVLFGGRFAEFLLGFMV